MVDLVALTAPYRETFLLVLFRVGGMVVAAPVLGHRAIPMPHRAGLAALLALLLTPLLGGAAVPRDAIGLALAIAGELCVGLVIGFVATLVLAAVQAAGEVVGFQMGLGIAAVYDPSMGQQMNVVTRFHEFLALLLLLSVNGHHALIQAVAASFHRLRPGTVVVTAGAGAGVLALGGKLFRSGLELAAPLVAVLFVVNVVLALLARVAPQMNVFVLGVSVTVAVGLLGMVESGPYFFGVVTRLVSELGRDFDLALGGLAHGG